jgi:phosphoribosylanthranilate isomerase
MRVKICGITNPADAVAAVDAGADALGFVFCEQSPRRLSIARACEITRTLPPYVAKVGVFVDAPEAAIKEAIRECRLDTIQLHGNEPPEFCLRFPDVNVCKAFRIRNADSVTALAGYQADAFLLDSFDPGRHGGTGARFNWEWAGDARKFGRPIILAGGLTAENVAQAISLARPYAVDVSSGVESAPGKKDAAKVAAFIQAAKQSPAGAVLPGVTAP